MNGDEDKGPNYSCKNIHQRSVPPPTEVCRCADVAIVLPNKAESHTVALPRQKKDNNRGLTSSPAGAVGVGGREVTHTELRSH